MWWTLRGLIGISGLVSVTLRQPQTMPKTQEFKNREANTLW
jgi:hypothetical protein